jgi:hypothetical protein
MDGWEGPLRVGGATRSGVPSPFTSSITKFICHSPRFGRPLGTGSKLDRIRERRRHDLGREVEVVVDDAVLLLPVALRPVDSSSRSRRSHISWRGDSGSSGGRPRSHTVVSSSRTISILRGTAECG